MSNKKSAIYITIIDEILNEIVAGKYNIGDKLPTESEIMDQYSVSRMTANKALDTLAQKNIIVRHPGKGSFVSEKPNLIHENKPTVFNKKMVGVVLPTVYPCFGTKFLHEISSILQKKNIFLVFSGTENDQYIEANAIKDIKALPIEGLIIWPAPGKYIGNEILKLVLNDFPVVLLDRYIQEIETNYVVTNNKTATIKALDHLMELGHKKIAVLSKSMEHDSSIKDRIHSVMDYLTMVDQDTNYFSGIIEVNSCDYKDPAVIRREKDNLKKKLTEFFSLHPQTTAFLVTEYYPATLLYETLTELNYRVPDDFSIVCFDSPEFYLERSVRFTHIQQNEKALAEQAVLLLLEAIENHGEKKHQLIEAELVLGETTSPSTTTSNDKSED